MHMHTVLCRAAAARPPSQVAAKVAELKAAADAAVASGDFAKAGEALDAAAKASGPANKVELFQQAAGAFMIARQ